MRRAAILVAAAIFAAPAPARADTDEQLAVKVMALIEVAAGVVEVNRSDCGAMGDKLSKMTTDNAAFIDQVKARAEKISPDELRAIAARYQTRLQAAMAKAKPGLDRCRSHPKVAAVLHKLEQ